MRVLNLYAGLGGNRKLWENVEVTAVEMEPDIAAVYLANFPNDKVIVGDAHKYLIEHESEFDFVWSSPPCQTHTKMMKATRHKRKRYTDMALWQEIIFLQHFRPGSWVVENVTPFYEPLIKPERALGRHLFWSNFRIGPTRTQNHDNFIKADSPEEIESLKKWIGIHYEGNIYYRGNHSPAQVLRNCVHPEVGLHVLNCLLGRPKQLETLPIFKLTEPV